MISLENIINGIKNTRWPCRLEIVKKGRLVNLLPKNSILYIDGAHNVAGAKVIAEFLKSEEKKDSIQNYIINGRTKNTDSTSFLAQFKGIIKAAALVKVQMEPLSESPYTISKFATQLGIENFIASSLYDGIEKILNHASNSTPACVRICICGSFYLARDLKIENELNKD